MPWLPALGCGDEDTIVDFHINSRNWTLMRKNMDTWRKEIASVKTLN